MIYLDNNATTRPTDAVVRAVQRGLADAWHNPSSVHRAGQAARAEVERSRVSVASLIGARPREITFTSGGTEAIDLALRGGLAAAARDPARRDRLALVTTRVEHAAVRSLAESMARSMRVEWAPIDREGVVEEGTLASLAQRAAIVSLQWANNETGVVQPIERLVAACRAAGALVHVDATQWIGKMPADVGDLGADLVTFSPHKFHGPKGVGVLWRRAGVAVEPTLHGAQEFGRRAGTENVPGIMGAGAACAEAAAWLADAAARDTLARLRDRLERGVLERVDGAVVNGVRADGSGPPRLWNTTNIGFPRLEAEAMLLLLSERGVCASAGAACSSGSLDPSPVLLAMGVPPEVAHGSIRFSLSRESSADEVEAAIPIIAEAARRLSQSSSAV